jgi:hypothetical protein
MGEDIWLYKESYCDDKTIHKRYKVLLDVKEILLSPQPKENTRKCNSSISI